MTYIYQYDTDFTIKPENIHIARRALLEIEDAEEDTTLRGLLKEWGFALADYDNDEGIGTGITHIEYLEEKQDDEQMNQLFTILAPSVEPGSQICFYDDNGEHFRYSFAHGMVFRQEGEVVFPDVPKVPDFWSLPPTIQKDILKQIEKGASDDEE